MKFQSVVIVALGLFAAAPALAEGEKFAGYVIKAKSDVVDGVMLADGYTPTEVMNFLRADCASGQLGQMTYVGKPYKRQGHTFQKFRTTCAGGPTTRFGQTSQMAVEIERTPEGGNLTEYTFGINGEVRYERVMR